MSQQYRRVNMSEVQRVLDAMQPGGAYTSDYLADVTGMDWRRVIFALLKAEDKGLIEVKRPDVYRMSQSRNLYWKVTRHDRDRDPDGAG